MVKETNTLKINYNNIILWLQRQGIAIVVLIAVNAGTLFYFKTVTANMKVKQDRMEISIQYLNDRLIDCEKSKLDLLKDLKISSMYHGSN